MHRVTRPGQLDQGNVHVLQATAQQAQFARRGAPVGKDVLVNAGHSAAITGMVFDVALIRHHHPGAGAVTRAHL